MSGVRLFMFVVALPALAALGFDIWMYVQHSADQAFMLSTPGYLWTHYHPESYKQVFESIDPQYWPWMHFVLGQKGVVVGAAFAGFFYVLLGILKILRLPPFRDGSVDRFSYKKKF
jgi:hypothetical protein